MVFDGTFTQRRIDLFKEPLSKKGALDHDLIQYMSFMEAELDAFIGAQKAAATRRDKGDYVGPSPAFLDAFYEEISLDKIPRQVDNGEDKVVESKVLEVSFHFDGSRIMEKCIQISNAEQLETLFSHFEGGLLKMAESPLGSHVLQAILKRSRPMIEVEVKTSELLERKGTLEEKIGVITRDFISQDREFFFFDTYGSHITRSLLLTLFGKTPKLPGVQGPDDRDSGSYKVPTSFSGLLKQFLVFLSGIKEGEVLNLDCDDRSLSVDSIREMAMHPTASATLQLVIQIASSLIAENFLSVEERVFFKNIYFDGFFKDGKKSQLRGLLGRLGKHKNGSRYFEVFIQVFPKRSSTALASTNDGFNFMREIWDVYMSIEWKALLHDPNGNFILQAYLQALTQCSIDDRLLIMDAFLDKMLGEKEVVLCIVDKNRLGLLPKIASVLSSEENVRKFILILQIMFLRGSVESSNTKKNISQLDVENNSLLIPCLLSCQPLNRLDATAHFNLNGTLTLTSLFKAFSLNIVPADVSEYLVESFVNHFSDWEAMNRMAKHPIGSHCLEAFILYCSSGRGTKKTLKMIKKLLAGLVLHSSSKCSTSENIFVTLTTHKYASRIIEAVGLVLPKNGNEQRVLFDLVNEHKELLQKDRIGQFVMKNLAIDLKQVESSQDRHSQHGISKETKAKRAFRDETVKRDSKRPFKMDQESQTKNSERT